MTFMSSFSPLNCRILQKLIIKLLYIVEIDKLTSTQQQEWRTKGISIIIHQIKNETQTNEKYQEYEEMIGLERRKDYLTNKNSLVIF